MKGQTYYSGMAAQYAAEGNFEKAIELEKEGLEMWERIHGRDKLEYIFSLDQLAQYCYSNKNYLEAKRIEEDVISLLEGLNVTDP